VNRDRDAASRNAALAIVDPRFIVATPLWL
jgi:hypothetical protein